MHLARLANPALGMHKYSLSSLSNIYSKEISYAKDKIINFIKNKNKEDPEVVKNINEYIKLNFKLQKKDLKKLFQTKRLLKSGIEGKTFIFPNIEQLHTNEETAQKWVEYSVLDAEVTFYLREALALKLCQMPIVCKDEGMNNLYDLYLKYWLNLGECLTNMERSGIKINNEHFKAIEQIAIQDRNMNEKKFLEWVYSIQENCQEFNPSSSHQMQQLLFAPFHKIKT